MFRPEDGQAAALRDRPPYAKPDKAGNIILYGCTTTLTNLEEIGQVA